MYSLSKIALSEEIAQVIVSHYFGSRRKINAFEELKEGLFNAAAMLELDDGLKCVIKVAPPDSVRVLRYEKNIMKAEVESMQTVRQKTSVPVPEIYCYDISRKLLPSDFFIMQFLPGAPFNKLRPNLSPEAQASVEREMGQMTRQISEITNNRFGYWAQPEPVGITWRQCFARMVQGVMQDGKDIDVKLALPYEDLYGLMQSRFDVLDDIETPRLVHWDLWDGNVFVDPQTERVTGLIDFERTMWADPLIEAIFGWMAPNSNAVKGYGKPVFQSKEDFLRRMLYNSYLFLIMIIECYYRQFETQDQENWARTQLDRTIVGLQRWPEMPVEKK